MQYSRGNLREAWQGIKIMASVNQGVNESWQFIRINRVDDSELPNALNTFFSRFERPEFSENVSKLRGSLVSLNEIVITQKCVTDLFRRVNMNKAAGPDAICGHILRHCADQLSEVFL